MQLRDIINEKYDIHVSFLSLTPLLCASPPYKVINVSQSQLANTCFCCFKCLLLEVCLLLISEPIIKNAHCFIMFLYIFIRNFIDFKHFKTFPFNVFSFQLLGKILYFFFKKKMFIPHMMKNINKIILMLWYND